MTTAPQPAGAALLDGMPPVHDDLLAGMPAASGLLSGMPTADQAPAQPGLWDRLMGIGERGMVGGVDGLVNTAQSAGRWADAHLGNNDFLDRIDQRLDNFPVAKNLDQALDADHPYAPQSSGEKIAQGVMSGLTGGALTGGLSVVPCWSARAWAQRFRPRRRWERATTRPTTSASACRCCRWRELQRRMPPGSAPKPPATLPAASSLVPSQVT